jgi:hypothetical protein
MKGAKPSFGKTRVGKKSRTSTINGAIALLAPSAGFGVTNNTQKDAMNGTKPANMNCHNSEDRDIESLLKRTAAIAKQLVATPDEITIADTFH